MKTILSTPLFIGIGFLSSLQGQENYEFFLDQQNLSGGGFFRAPIERTGTMLSALPVPIGGSEFTVWAMEDRGSEAPVWHKIAEETVAAYLPTATLSIQTSDPFAGGIPRTRVDQPFTLNLEVEGLLGDLPDAPEAAMRVLLDHRVASIVLEDGPIGPQLEGAESQLFAQGFIEMNGAEARSYLGNLPGDDPFEEAGLETFTILALPDGIIASQELASAKVQIWPLASAEITGVESGVVYRSIPEVEVDLENIYPDSETYVQIYLGAAELNTEGEKILDSVLIVNDDKPRDGTLQIPDLSRYIDDSGTWTIEIITETPFGIDRVAFVEFVVDMTVKFRGGVHSFE